jgi:predicted sulfurtransferase
LADLILRVSMNVQLHAVDTGRGVITGRAVQVHAYTVGLCAEPASFEALPFKIEHNETSPSHSVCIRNQDRIAIVALGLEVSGVDA